jgi:hypothetical protein
VSEPRKFVEVTIAGRTLKLSPLPPEQVKPLRETCDRWEAAKGKPGDEAFFKDVRDSLAFIFLCAKPFHPDLTLAELENDVENGELSVLQEISSALDALAILTWEHVTGLEHGR